MVAFSNDFGVPYRDEFAPDWIRQMLPFSDRLRELRQKRGYTQAEVAARLSQYMKTHRKAGDNRKHNYTPQQVAEWERGAQPRPELATALSRVFGVTIDFLLGLTDNEESKLVEEGLSPEERELIQQLRLFPEQASLIYKALEIRRSAPGLPGSSANNGDQTAGASGPKKVLKG